MLPPLLSLPYSGYPKLPLLLSRQAQWYELEFRWLTCQCLLMSCTTHFGEVDWLIIGVCGLSPSVGLQAAAEVIGAYLERQQHKEASDNLLNRVLSEQQKTIQNQQEMIQNLTEKMNCLMDLHQLQDEQRPRTPNSEESAKSQHRRSSEARTEQPTEQPSGRTKESASYVFLNDSTLDDSR